MTEETTLRCVFEGNGSRRITMSWRHADPTTPAAQVRTLMQEIVANGDIFSDEPVSIVGAEFVTRQVTQLNVSD
jgi:hypothetical protein